MANPFIIDNCMHKNPVTIAPDATVSEAVKLIIDNSISGLTVTAEDGEVLGVISELDCLKAVLGTMYNDGNAGLEAVRDHMCTDVLSCRPEDDIVAVAQDMLDKNHRRRPVLQDGKLAGQLSCRNILWAIMEYSGPQASLKE